MEEGTKEHEGFREGYVQLSPVDVHSASRVNKGVSEHDGYNVNADIKKFRDAMTEGVFSFLTSRTTCRYEDVKQDGLKIGETSETSVTVPVTQKAEF
ncbi:hypothetical protein LENED_012486 [Lentinula edodes]|uniref:Uncharacterized protein n=1 Tax=Lentinula edodes TaxID=5353 RepID=A0A1Q3ESU1_LENED|nr:hypothetical protein LENED_012486 [Lentinula edodes]